MKKLQRISQILSAVLYNSWIFGFLQANIYQGRFKVLPCPGLNCHSCPSAVTTCPIGALQLFASFSSAHVSLYVVGFLGTIGAIGGRIVCGWACPFGLLQDLLARLPVRKIAIPRFAEYTTKYVILVGVVFLMALRTYEPWFCKVICPAGTLEAGIPLLLLNDDLRQLIGPIFYTKISLLVLFLVGMVFIKRPFCRLVCPLGAIYSVFNRSCVFSITVDRTACIKCDRCFTECPVAMRVYAEKDGVSSCVRCFRCVKACPVGAVAISQGAKKFNQRNP